MGVALGSFRSLPVNFCFPVVNVGGGGRPSQPLSRSLIISWDFALVPTFLHRENAHLYQGPCHSLAILMFLEKFEAAVDNRRIRIRSKCGTCYFEQDDERVCMVVVQLVMRDEGLEDVTTNRIFFHVSGIGAVCTEVNGLIVIVLGQAVTSARDCQIGVEESLKNPSTEVEQGWGPTRHHRRSEESS